MRTVLIVDDEPMLREALSFSLRRRGYRVLEAENGTRAFELLRADAIEIVISDVRMPGGDGIELLKRVRAELGAAPPVILVSGFADLSEPQAIELGAAAMLLKPCDFKTLLQTAESALKNAA